MASIDAGTVEWFYKHKKEFLDKAMPKITRLGDAGAVWLAMSAALILQKDKRKTGMACLSALGIDSVLCNLVIKPIVRRPRPFKTRTLGSLLIREPKDPSFPSGHTSASFAMTTALLCEDSPLWLPSLIISILIGISRMYLHVHYLSDVAAGALIGVACGKVGADIVK